MPEYQLKGFEAKEGDLYIFGNTRYHVERVYTVDDNTKELYCTSGLTGKLAIFTFTSADITLYRVCRFTHSRYLS